MTPDITQTKGYKKRLEELQNINFNTDYDIGILGDSLAHAIRPNILRNCCSLKLLNLAIPGETSESLLKKLPLKEKLQVKRLYILVGTNDIGRNISPTTTIENVSSIIENHFKDNELALLLIPFSDGWNRDNKKILEMNKAYQSLCLRYTLDCIDLNTPLSEELQLKASLTKDGLHLNERGVILVSEFIANDFNNAKITMPH